MSNLKKILALALVFAIAFTMAAGATYPAGGYLDKDEINADTLDSIVYLANLGIMSGAPASTENEETGAVTQGFKFMPTDTLTRAQFCRMIYSIETGRDNADLYKTAVKTGFTDVPSGEWYAGFVNYAWLMGWVSGKSATRFDPNGELKLSEAVTLVLAYLGYDKADLAKAWPSNALLYGSIKGLFNNGVETSGAVNASIARQWAAVLITNVLDSTFVTKNDAGRYVDVSATTVKEAKLGSYKEIAGTIVANNRFALEGTKTSSANKFVVKPATGASVTFDKTFDPMNGVIFADTQAVSNSINLSDAFLGAKVKLLYRETAKGPVILTYAVTDHKSGNVAKADIKFEDADKLTVGTLAAKASYTDAEVAAMRVTLNGTAVTTIATYTDLKNAVASFPANTTFTFTVVGGKAIGVSITAWTFDKAEAVVTAEWPKQTPNEFGVEVTEIKIGGTTYKRADGKIVNTGSTSQGSNAAANKAALMAKDEYAVFWVDGVSGAVTVNKVAKTEGKVAYVVNTGDATTAVINVGTSLKQESIQAFGDFNKIANAANGRTNVFSADVSALAGADAFWYANGGVTYLLGMVAAPAPVTASFLYVSTEKQILGGGKFTYVVKGLEAGAAKSYTFANINVNADIEAMVPGTLYTLTISGAGVFTSAVDAGTYGDITDAAVVGDYTYSSANKTLTLNFADPADNEVYLLSGANIYGRTTAYAVSADKVFADGKAIEFKATQVGTTAVYVVSEIYVEQ